MPSEAFSGKLVTCTSTSGKTSATFIVTAPLAPVILSPQEHAQVACSKHTLIRYCLSQDGAFYVIALDPPQNAWTPPAKAQADPLVSNTSAFPVGPGSIAINQFFTRSSLRAPSFQSAQTLGNAQEEIQVSWV